MQLWPMDAVESSQSNILNWKCGACNQWKNNSVRSKPFNSTRVCNKCYHRLKRQTSKDIDQREENLYPSNPKRTRVNKRCAPLQENTISHSQHQTATEDACMEGTNDIRIGTTLRQAYEKQINVFASTPCNFCDKLMYPKQCKRFEMTQQIQTLLAEFDFQRILHQTCTVCNVCYQSLKRNKVPKTSTFNGLQLDEVPAEISCLTEYELRLISQVKLHMKIYKLCRGRGQPAMKGLVLHFPQAVDEVANVLSLRAEDADFVVIRETLENHDVSREYEVRPEKVFEALHWLKSNNPLYKNIQINIEAQLSRPIGVCETTQPETMMTSETRIGGWRCLESGASLLRGNLHQGHPVFGGNAGKQCTAMSASFIAYSAVQHPSTWTQETIQSVLFTGNRWYSEKVKDHTFLNVEDVEGNIRVFDSVNVRISINQGEEYAGYLNKYPGDVPRLSDQIDAFVRQSPDAAILTTNEYSFGLIKRENFVYFTDSHSRGPAGRYAANGTACVIKFSYDEVSNQLSQLIHRNCQPKQFLPENSSSFYFSLVTMSTSRDTDEESEDGISEPIMQNFTCAVEHEHAIVSASVIAPDDHVAPDIGELPAGNFINLNRQAGKPLYASNEKELDLLAFYKHFPRGRFGVNCQRRFPITILDYFQQRILCSDKRFESDTEFLFYALNECDRVRLEQRISVVCSMTTASGAEVEGLPAGASNPRLCMSAIRGSASYWQNFCGDLLAMVCHLGIPTFFLTISYDDLNAKDVIIALYKAEYGGEEMPPQSLFDDFNAKRDLLNKHPVTAARHFSYRLNKFKSILKANAKELFGREMSDFAYRIEFQARGSPHCHAVIWLQDAPSFNSEEGRKFLEKNISCTLQSPIKPLVERYQAHRHSHTCFKSGQTYCRFGFPRPVSEELEVLEDDYSIMHNGGRFVNLKRQKDEELINNYHPALLEILQCNMDIQPVTSSMAIVFYIAKYMSKAEPQEVRNEVRQIVQEIYDSNLTVREKMRKASLHMIRRREISAQEAAFRVCSLAMRDCSRKTVFVPTFPKEERLRMIRRSSLQSGTPEFGVSLIDRYMARPNSLEELCLYEFASYYEAKYHCAATDEDVFEEDDTEDGAEIGPFLTLKNGKGRIHRRQFPASVKMVRFNPESEPFKYFYSLLLLYRPFREENFCELREAPDFFKTQLNTLRSNSDDPIIRPELVQEIDRAMLLVENGNFVSEESRLESFLESFQDFPEEEPGEDQEQNMPTINSRFCLNGLINALNSNQRDVFHSVSERVRNGEVSRIVCFGEGGTGKSFLIRTITSYLQTYTNNASCLITCAPTGKAAFNVGGVTVHRAFALAVEHGAIPSYKKLSSQKLHSLRTIYRHVKWVILDEFSMLNYETFRSVHLRLCEVLDNEEPFGGLSVLLFGDFMQLRPVRGTWIFKKPVKYQTELDLWRLFEPHELKLNERQTSGDDLLAICSRLRIGKLTADDIEVLQTRLLDPANPNFAEMTALFEDCVWVNNKNKDVQTHNDKMSNKLLHSEVTMYTIRARDTYADNSTKHGLPIHHELLHKKESKCGGLPTTISIGIGSRVMVRRNINVKFGIVNGATGTITRIRWPALREKPLTEDDMPESITIKFDHEIRGSSNNECTVTPARVEFFAKHQTKIQRKQLPIIAAWSINTHKMQGVTCEKAVINLGKSLFAKAMAYVLLSRSKTLNGVAISSLDVTKLLTTATFTPCDLEALDELKRCQEVIESRKR